MLPLRTPALALALASLGCATAPPPRPVHHAYVYASDNDPLSGQPVNIGQVDMPLGESFSGSYHSAQLGDVFLEQAGANVTGTYQYDRGSCRTLGRLEGRTAGNLLRFTWTEDQSLCGHLQPLTGRGYMLFWMERNRHGVTNARLDGEWGMGDAELGNGHWAALRDAVRRNPPQQSGPARRGIFDEGAAPTPAPTPAPAAP
ncbi:MAG: hypothetical protein U0324_17480 [Polyangiales bacterium]